MSTLDTGNTNGVPDTFYIILQKSLADGVSPAPRERYLVTRATRSDKFMVDVKVRSPVNMLKMDPTINRLLKVSEQAKSILRFLQLMSEIPTQYCGVEDLYGRDTSVVHVTDPKRQLELHLSGNDAPKVPRPTEEQKVKFDEVVRIVENWGRSGGPLPLYD